eukprot:TRINITY_DN1984_c0_g1_i4.p1 TRINITY_DN1984_c0_g1~~TRINITY_DN1984_c0_g1_i4.p1  ORF type:complete len:453 (+),score=78.01 TRINITY_DN1984_c0_g1_i4:1550-2908(+)
MIAKLGWISILFISCIACQEVLQISGLGASFPSSIYGEWMYSYGFLSSSVKLDYTATGSSTGKNTIISGDTLFAGSDTPLSDEEFEENPHLVMYPMIIGPLVIAYNIEGYEDPLRLSRTVLPKISSGDIEYWDDPEILLDNPGLSGIHEKITIAVRKDGSGSTGIYTQGLSSMSSDWESNYGIFEDWPEELANMSHVFPTRYSYGIISHVFNIGYSIGYISYSDVKNTGLPIAQLENQNNNYIDIVDVSSLETIADNVILDKNNIGNLIDLEGESTWPLASFSYIIIDTTDANCTKKKEILRFYNWALNDDRAISRVFSSGFAALSSDLAETVIKGLSDFQCDDDVAFEFEQVFPSHYNIEGIIIIVITSLVLIYVFIITVGFIGNQQYEVFVISAKKFMIIILTSCTVGVISCYLYILKPGTISCGLQLWSGGITYSLIISCLIGKKLPNI